MSEHYIHVGKQPITVKGKTYTQGDAITANPEDMAFFLQIGAVVAKPTPTSRRAFTTAKVEE